MHFPPLCCNNQFILKKNYYDKQEKVKNIYKMHLHEQDCRRGNEILSHLTIHDEQFYYEKF